MSSVPYRSFIPSKPFLIIGPGKGLFYAHGGLLAGCSPVLDKDVHGGMQEAQLQTIEIQDVEGDIDDDTVMRFIEYAYSGDYTVPQPDIAQLPSDSKELHEAFRSTPPGVDRALDDWTLSWTGKKGKHDKKKRSRRLDEDPTVVETVVVAEEPATLESVVDCTPDVQQTSGPAKRPVDADRQMLWTSFRTEARICHRPAWRPSDNNDEREDYTSIFLCHARLYKFSDRYDCGKLTDLTLQKLRLTLSKYMFHAQRASDVVELVRYTYAHTVDVKWGRDKLRALVLDYVTCYFRELTESPPFLRLIQDGGSLPGDLMGRVAGMVS